MGQFSWLDCIDESQIVDDAYTNVYLLVPKQFGGGHIVETCYDGYGNFGGVDVYDLVADWNREMIPEILRRINNRNWVCDVDEADKRNLQAFYEGKKIDCEKRWIGIIMGCYDQDNAALEYPIKITHSENAVYEECRPSKSDPDQGWRSDYDDEDY